MQTNYLGQVYGALAALPFLRESGGTLVCIGSVESVRAVPLHAPYVASKMALRGFCDALRMDLDEEKAGVAVSLIMPAAIDTPFFEHSPRTPRTLPSRRTRCTPPSRSPGRS
jgi:short-subunit dehydrogenase